LVLFFSVFKKDSVGITRIPVHFIDQFGNRGLAPGLCIVPVDALPVGLHDRDHGIAGEAVVFHQYFPGHLPDTVFREPGFLCAASTTAVVVFSVLLLRDDEEAPDGGRPVDPCAVRMRFFK
jgi:hypothetical protein